MGQSGSPSFRHCTLPTPAQAIPRLRDIQMHHHPGHSRVEGFPLCRGLPSGIWQLVSLLQSLYSAQPGVKLGSTRGGASGPNTHTSVELSRQRPSQVTSGPGELRGVPPLLAGTPLKAPGETIHSSGSRSARTVKLSPKSTSIGALQTQEEHDFGWCCSFL